MRISISPPVAMLLRRTGKRLKRASSSDGHHHDDNDGLPLSDDILLLIFSGFLDMDDDLVRCAATCRRWRRLVSSEAAFICRSDPARFVPVGFFHQGESYGFALPPRFVTLASHFPPGASAADALLAGEPFRSSRLVTSRKGRLVVDLVLYRPSLRLAVCNPMAGDVTVLPALSGRDKPGRYACALLTAGDDARAHAAEEEYPPSSASSSSFRLVIVYDRRDFTACRTYSSDAGNWGPEAKVSGARVRGNSLAQIHPAAAVVGGAVFWWVRDAVLRLRVDTLEAAMEPLPAEDDWARRHRKGYGPGRLLAVSPDGRLCVVEAGIRLDAHGYNHWKNEVAVRVLFREHSGAAAAASGERWVASRWGTVQLEAPSGYYSHGLTRVCLRGVCEKSGVVFLAAGFEAAGDREALYALDVEMMKARLLHGVRDVGGWCRLGSRASLHGYEMDRVAFVSSLGKRDYGKFNMNHVQDVYDF